MSQDNPKSTPKISRVDVGAFEVPTQSPESDGTLQWTATTIVVVELTAAGATGLGYTYCHKTAAAYVRSKLAPLVEGASVFDIERLWWTMLEEARNDGRSGIAACAISAVDNALWDLEAKLLDLPLVDLLGTVRDGIEGYGSGGFTSYTERELCEHLATFVEHGMTAVKMKIGREPGQDLVRVAAARRAIGDGVGLFVDANGAYHRKQALAHAQKMAEHGVTWFEEPVSSDDLEGLRMLCERAPAITRIAAGEYGYDPIYFRRMLQAQAVDVLQADATRCLGVTGFLKAAALCDAFDVPLSAHCAPSLHAPLGCAVHGVCHVEYFFDHARLEQMLFDGAPQPNAGLLMPARDRLGLGLELKRRDAARHEVNF